jgi:hypothetical protein
MAGTWDDLLESLRAAVPAPAIEVSPWILQKDVEASTRGFSHTRMAKSFASR